MSISEALSTLLGLSLESLLTYMVTYIVFGFALYLFMGFIAFGFFYVIKFFIKVTH